MNSQVIKYFTKHVTILKTVKFLRILMGYYNPTNLSKRLVWTSRAYSFIFWLMALHSVIEYLYSFYLFHMAEFFLSITLSLYIGDEFFFKYCRVTETNDLIIGNELSVFDIGIKFIILVVIAFRVFLMCLKHFTHTHVDRSFFTVTFVIAASRLTCLLVAIIFVILYVRMKYLRQRMEKNTVPINIISKDGILSKVREVRRCLLYYNNLLDSVADIDRDLQCSLAVVIIFCIPKLVTFSYMITKDLYTSEYDIGFGYIHLFNMLEAFCLTCLPAIAAELVKKETEKIKWGLSKQLVRCSDESLRFELQVALQYMEHRPFNFMMFYAIPLDISVPIGIVSLCITYVIVALQLKHFTIEN